MDFVVQDVYKRFGEKKVLEGISFATEGGKAFGLLGRNGAGKTTTIRIVMGVFPADGGVVLVDGKPINQQPLRIGYLPEEHGLYPKKKIREQLEYLGELQGMRPAAARQSITRWMGRLGIEEYTERKLDTLSKGNQQKIQMVAALITDPEILILDEPFSGLDPVNAALLKAVVKEQIAQGRVVLFSSHQMNYVEEFCDAIAILHKGQIVLSGDIDEIKRSYERDRIEVRSGASDAIEAFARGQLTHLLRDVQRRQDRLCLDLKDPAGKTELMAALAAQGFDIDSFEVYEPSLNDIFVEYTGDEANNKEEVAS